MRVGSTLPVTEDAMKMNNSGLFCRREATPFNVRAKIVCPRSLQLFPHRKRPDHNILFMFNISGHHCSETSRNSKSEFNKELLAAKPTGI